MVDAVVSFAVERLGDALIRETLFSLCVRSQVDGLRDELVRMWCFLKEAETQLERHEDERVRHWIAEIRNIAYDAEDVLDTFIVNTRQNERSHNFIIRKALKIKNLQHMYKVGKEIHAIHTRLKVTYGIKNVGDNKETWSSKENQRMRHPLRNHYPHVEDDDTKTLVTELMKDEIRLCVISIVGVGGLGKTTQAKKIYRHHTIKNHFDCCAWSSISQQFNARDVLIEIMKKDTTPTDDELKMNEGDLVETVYNYYEGKRYMVVLDDRWSLHFEPQLLTEENSWELLRAKAFPRNTDDKCYSAGLEKLGREMAHKCAGLPLEICVLGGLLATKKSGIKEWEFDFSLEEGRFKTCRVHDLLRDLCLSKAKETNFLDTYDQQHRCGDITSHSLCTVTHKRLRKYAIHLDDDTSKRYNVFYFLNSDCALRTNNPKDLPLASLNYQNITLLLGKGFQISSFKVFSVRGSTLPDTPISSSIGNLRNLETLKLIYFEGCLPKTLTRLVKLRHLQIFRGWIHAGKWIRKGDLGKLFNLRQLSVEYTSRLQTDVILKEVAGKDQYHNPIRSLALHSGLDGLNLHRYPPNISKIYLSQSRLEEDPMESLQYLPNLRFLWLDKAYQGEEMACSTTGFRQLQHLVLISLEQLQNWRVDQGGMVRLKQFITTLQEMKISSMPSEFKDGVVRENGEDWYKVLHVPSIQVP
ncbi:hypothetical protein MKW92_052713 [Papaver armeniacum]|nr:hypothetical protein MKW92_052713 [Papaver armeniacum]